MVHPEGEQVDDLIEDLVGVRVKKLSDAKLALIENIRYLPDWQIYNLAGDVLVQHYRNTPVYLLLEAYKSLTGNEWGP
jgi:hypothetical protein